ncbi:hypothetical protein Mapa_008681 [Marchantia paleacea]|nr:hypothetical protein Mapa_008681 [Marchantia paleacea]
MESVEDEARILRESKIQQELDLRRSGSSSGSSSSRSLSAEEEDELEGMAGDTGSARRLDDPDSVEARISLGSGAFPRPSSLEAENKLSAELGEKGLEEARVASTSRSSGQLQGEGKLCSWLEFLSVLAHLTAFGIIGVLIRFGLEQLFGPPVAGVTTDNSALFNDLPANMLGSFFMGWVGVVYKKDISLFSEHLAVGLSTGLMGSITTYAAMIQRMLANMVGNHWMNGIVGLLIGMELAQISLIVGVDSAKLLNKILERINHNRGRKGLKRLQAPAPDNLSRRYWSVVLFLVLGGFLWMGSLILTVFDSSSNSRRTLWLACLVAPPGVWMRWYFARLNGQGIGPKHYLRWLPFGTLLVNVSASTIEAALATVEVAVGNYNARLLVGGLQLGLLGCLSTVSTFAAEIQIMHQGRNRWRAYVYPVCTILTSLVIGFLIYGVPVWVLGLGARYRPLEK